MTNPASDHVALAVTLVTVLLLGLLGIIGNWRRTPKDSHRGPSLESELDEGPPSADWAAPGNPFAPAEWILRSHGPETLDDARIMREAQERIRLVRLYVHDETPVVPEKPIPSKGVLRILCGMGLHWSGTTDGGLMGDRQCCDHCGMDRYPENFSGKLLYPRRMR